MKTEIQQIAIHAMWQIVLKKEVQGVNACIKKTDYLVKFYALLN